jgi:hypothetical protein
LPAAPFNRSASKLSNSILASSNRSWLRAIIWA